VSPGQVRAALGAMVPMPRLQGSDSLREAIHVYSRAMHPYYGGHWPCERTGNLTYREAGELREAIYSALHARTAPWVAGET
jgi:hypothetical protein